MAKAHKRIEWLKVLEFFLVMVVIPTFLFSILAFRAPNILRICYYTVVTILVMQAALSYLQSLGAFFRKRFPRGGAGVDPADQRSVPKTSFIICAYLPNEVDIIETTVLNVLDNVKRPDDGIEVILSYNTPHMEPVEMRLKELAYKYPELILANAYGSRSKSQNLNYALDMASGEIIALLDADHLVEADCLAKAWRWLSTGDDAVQGRCKIRNGGRSALASIIEIEFEGIYAISHYAKSLLFRTALFGGSDCYWKAEVLKEFGFRTDMLTEDIDTTLRALLAGKSIVHDRSILSRELAPETLGALWFQRKRWAQGWFQCTLRHQWAVLKSRYLHWRAKLMWSLLLVLRTFHDIMSHMLPPILFAYWIGRKSIYFPMTAYIWFALFFTLGSGPFEAIAAFKNAFPPRPPARRLLLYCMLTLPYAIFKNIIHMVAIRDELLGKREWIVSPHRPTDGRNNTNGKDSR
ncbi:MAG: glycosyltransferase family 2 protein [Planctomycetota bacterium]|jgi:cellulose synthase/poly-beta-1,6-N-acetylglucosamine synthase-like glycosyltransferase